MPHQTLVADGRHLDGVAVLHHGKSRQDGTRGEIGVLDRPAGLVEDLPERQRNRLQQGHETAVSGFGEPGQEAVSRPCRWASSSLPSVTLPISSSGKDHRWQGPDPEGSPDVKKAMNSQERNLLRRRTTLATRRAYGPFTRRKRKSVLPL